MFRFLTAIFLFLSSGMLFGQVKYTDKLSEKTLYDAAPQYIQRSKAFMRERWFYEQRAHPDWFIPANAYQNAIQQRDNLRLQNADSNPGINWVSLGPTPGQYFNYGNISSRVVTGAFDPANPNIIYIGPANGGVWKSTDGGVTWAPLTDDQESMAMGSIAIDPTNTNIIYAGTGEATYSGASYYGRGLLKSTDGGNSWIHITNGLPNSTYFSRLKIRPGHPNELIAALGNNGLYRSTDSGISWSQIFGNGFQDVVFTPTGDTVFALGGAAGLKRSTDGGASFQSYGSGLISGTRAHLDLCLSYPAYMYSVVYGSGEVRIFKSTDSGSHWFELPRNSTFTQLDGQAWYDLYVRANPFNRDKAYIGTIDVFATTDGTNFVDITNGYSGGSVHVDQHYLFFHPMQENTFIVCNDGGVWKTSNNGNTFANLNQNLTLTQFYRITASPFDPGRILGGTQDNGTQQTFSNLHWAAAFGGDGGDVAFNHFDDNFIIGETQFGGLQRTTNGGNNWISATNGLNMNENVAWVAPIIEHPTKPGTFIVARQKVYRSSNNGGNWTAISGNINNSGAVREMAISKSNPTVMCASSGSKIFISTDGGANWNNRTIDLPNKTITSVHIHPENDKVILLTFSGFGTSKVFKTTDGGNRWVDINGDLPDAPVNDIFIYTLDPDHPNTYFAATDIGVFMTRDNGVKWVELFNGLPNTVIMHLDFSPSTSMLRAGTHGRGVYEAFLDMTIPVELTSFNASLNKKGVTLNWETSTETNNMGFDIQRKLKNQNWKRIGFVEGSGTTSGRHLYSYFDDFSLLPYEGRILYRLKQIDFDGSSDFSEQVFVDVSVNPVKYSVSQNYPNPFNPTTTIEYTLHDKSEVRINIYNSIGQKITTLVSAVQNAGIHKVKWDGTNFSSGIYFYSFEVIDGNRTVVRELKKLVLMK